MKKNILANFAGRFWSVLSSFLFVPIYINILGLENYSIISFTMILNGIMLFMDAGLTATLSREFADSNNSTSDKLRIYRTLESCYFIISAFVIIIMLSVSNLIAFHWINLESIPPSKVSFYLKIISTEIGLRLLSNFYSGGFIGLEKQVKSNMYQVAYGLFRNGLVIFIILFFPSLQVFFIWQALTTFVYVFIIRFDLSYSLSKSSNLFFSKPHIEIQVISKIWKFAGGMMLISMISGLNSQIDKLALSKLLPIEILGLYTLAFAISSGLSIISGPISTAILPRMTALFTSEKNEEAIRVFNIGYLFVSIVIFSFTASLIFFSKDLIIIWINNIEIAEKAHVFVPWIAAGTSFLALGNLPFNVAIANGYTRYNNILGVSSLLITLPGYWILTSIFGAIGAAITYSFVQVLIVLVYLYLVNQKFMHLNAKILYLKNFFLPIVISLLTTFVLYNILNFDNCRFIILLKIGFVITCSIILNTLILVPFKTIAAELNKIVFYKKK